MNLLEIKETYNQIDTRASFLFWMGVSLIIHLTCAWFSIGFIHYDEHFQIIEFATMKLGWIRPEQLPWEYSARIRPGLQPGIVYAFLRLSGLTDPFTITFILRLISAIFGWGVTWLFTSVVSKKIEDKQAKKYLFILTAVYGFQAYIHAHFSSESWSGSTCFLGLSLFIWLLSREIKSTRRYAILGICGLCFGFSYVFRMQVIIIPIAAVIWGILAKKLDFKDLLLMICSGVAAIAIGALADKWFYGEWVNTTFNYFRVNIIEGKAAHFGTLPWFWYILAVILKERGGAASWEIYSRTIAFTPASVLGLLLALCFIYFWVRYPKSVFTAISLPFFIIHSLISHKEFRFLFPLIDIVPFIIAFVFYKLREKYNYSKPVFFRYLPAVGCIAVLIAGRPYVQNPAWENFEAYKFLNDYKHNELCILGYNKDIYQMRTTLPLLFYKPSGFYPKDINTIRQADSALESSPRPVYLYISQKGFNPPAAFDSVSFTYKMVFCTMPGYLKNCNLNHWQKRTSSDAIYLIRKKSI